MRRTLLAFLVAVPLTVVAWAFLASFAASGIVAVQKANFVMLSEAELMGLDKPALAKLAANAVASYERSSSAWEEAAAVQRGILWGLSGMVVFLVIALVVVSFANPPNKALQATSKRLPPFGRA